MMKLIDLSGKSFGEYTVIGRDFVKSSRGEPYWLCRCSCGNVKSVRSSHLRYGESIQCRECLGKKQRKNVTGNIPVTYWLSIKRGAESRGHLVTATATEAWQKYVDQNGLCAISGLPISFHNGRKLGKGGLSHTASLDRIDSIKGYEPGNIQWVYKPINIMKHKMDQSEFISLCVIIAEHNKSQASHA